ncbi:MAG TPA: cation-translocating P-type ATPase [Ignavibacteria bacterium]|nr:haloacid dehalogenase [Bacteroidota bacterium]HRI84918.1 cation-translocating P-type ATPase [Ignavibacteria bacterium]HRJ99569.1 cation-translocating P-type ATPase [Ignavibacteria bacterium]
MESIDTGTENKSTGLSSEEVLKQRELFGANRSAQPKNLLLENLKSVFFEPMFILLLAACCIYFILNELSEAFTMFAALLFVAGIDIFQNFRSQKAIKALSRITKSKTKVLRDSEIMHIDFEEVVTNDIIICEEGDIIPADADIISSSDFSLNEAILTGESVSVEKFSGDKILQGTLAVRGYCHARVTAVGIKTTLSGIGELVSGTGKDKTPLQIKVANFVRIMVIAGSAAFAFVWIYYWWESGSMIHGLLHGLTMAMSVLPEEIPVALSTFMALGAYRLLKAGVIARSPGAVETLGSATVICVDKTGTLTQNLMKVSNTLDVFSGEEVDFNKFPKASEILEYAMWASEESPFDPMEISIHQFYSELYKTDERKNYKMVKEFPLSGSPPVMTHIYQNNKKDFILSCKGAPEGVLKLCSMSEEDKSKILKYSEEYAEKGLRVLGVAKGEWTEQEYPGSQEEIKFKFLGIITFYDPPDPHIPKVIQSFYEAGVDVKMITGDYLKTAVAVAGNTGIKTDRVITGIELSEIKDEELKNTARSVNIFARVNPETKLRIINALKQSGEIVAMTGDGVNDAPALKSAHIGVAMGKRGTEVAKGAAGLILSGDDLSKMTDAIFLGRRINENLIRAIRYIISIHIPIILLVMLPIFLWWLPESLFTPIHVIFLELIMGPTCSIIYENEPAQKDELMKPADSANKNLLKTSQLLITIVQGLMITLGCVLIGFYGSYMEFDDVKIRTLIFSTLIISNIFLTLLNRSFTNTIFVTIRRKNKLIPLIISLSLLFLLLILNVPFLNNLFDMSPLKADEFLLPVMTAFASTFWIEPIKFFRFRKKGE